jgi:hypothetical protein
VLTRSTAGREQLRGLLLPLDLWNMGRIGLVEDLLVLALRTMTEGLLFTLYLSTLRGESDIRLSRMSGLRIRLNQVDDIVGRIGIEQITIVEYIFLWRNRAQNDGFLKTYSVYVSRGDRKIALSKVTSHKVLFLPVVTGVDEVMTFHSRSRKGTMKNATQKSCRGKFNVREYGALNSRFIYKTQMDDQSRSIIRMSFSTWVSRTCATTGFITGFAFPMTDVDVTGVRSGALARVLEP